MVVFRLDHASLGLIFDDASLMLKVLDFDYFIFDLVIF